MEEHIQQELSQITTQLDLLKSKDIRGLQDALRVIVAKIDRLQQQGDQSDSIDQLATALAKAKLERLPLKESGTGNRGKYSTLEDYEDSYEKPLAKNGLSIIFTPQAQGQDSWVLVTTLVHASGQWKKSMLPIDMSEEVNKTINEEQGFGKSISYMKRYSYAAMMGV